MNDWIPLFCVNVITDTCPYPDDGLANLWISVNKVSGLKNSFVFFTGHVPLVFGAYDAKRI